MSRFLCISARFPVAGFLFYCITACEEPRTLSPLPPILNDTLSPFYTPRAVENFKAKILSGASVELTWDDMSVAEKGFLLLRRIDPVVVFDTAAILPPNSEFFIDSLVLLVGRKYTYGVSAIGNTIFTSQQRLVSFVYDGTVASIGLGKLRRKDELHAAFTQRKPRRSDL